MKMRISVLLLALWLLPTATFAQYTDYRDKYRLLDSLERVLATDPPTGDNLLVLYRDLAWGNLGVDSEKLRYYSELGIPLARQAGYSKVTSFFYSWLGLSEYHEGRYDSAMEYYNKALDAAGQMKKDKGSDGKPYPESNIDDRFAATYGDIGNLYNAKGDLHLAVEYYLRALAIFEKYDWKAQQAIAYDNMGAMYLAMENYPQAEENYRRIADIAHQIGDSLFMAYANGGLSKIELEKKNYDRALEHAEAASAYYFTHPEEGNKQAGILNTLAQIHLEGYDDDAKAETYVLQALQLTETNEVMTVTQAATLGLLAEIHLRRGEWRAARDTALQSLALDDEDFTNTLPAYKVLAKAYSHLGDTARADEYFDRHDSLQASWATKHYQSAIRDMEVKYETEKIQTRVATLEDERRLMIWLGIAAMFVLTLLVATLIFRQKNLATQKKLTEERMRRLEEEQKLAIAEAELDSEAAERARLARDLHDGLGGMLAAVKINLQNGDKAYGLIDDSMLELRRIAHHLMPESLVRCGLKTSLEVFCGSLPGVRFHYFGEDVRFDGRRETLIYRSAHELINNALKYSDATEINVQLIQEPDRVSLTVQDNGRGFDPLAITEGMGLDNLRQRMAVFGGELHISSALGQGTEIVIELTLANGCGYGYGDK